VAVKRRELLLAAVVDPGAARVGGLFKLLPRPEGRDEAATPAFPERELMLEESVLDFAAEVAGMPRLGGAAADVRPRFVGPVAEDFVAVGEEG
jgi:hypothetical protein